MYNKFLINKTLKLLEHIEYGSLKLELADGKVYNFLGKNKGLDAHIALKTDSVIKTMLFDGDIGFAKTYKDGLWQSDNVAIFLHWALSNESVLKQFIFGNKLSQFVSKLAYLFRLNTVAQAKDNIHAHYDLGNEFYSLWLDKSMSYSAAIFNDLEQDLEQAQANKYNRILDIIGKNDKILEIGCGWGGFMQQASQSHLAVDGLTISQAQFDYAKRRLDGIDEAQIFLRDYRLHEGQYKSIVSIEMFEAVGERYWQQYFDKLKASLAAKGRAVIQTITIANEHFQAYRDSADAMRSYIFPGGMLPSKERFNQVSSAAKLQVIDCFSFGQDYAKTLERWLVNFNAKQSEVLQLGFDEAFCRLWQFYLSYCIAGFRSKRIDVMQAALEHQQ